MNFEDSESVGLRRDGATLHNQTQIFYPGGTEVSS